MFKHQIIIGKRIVHIHLILKSRASATLDRQTEKIIRWQVLCRDNIRNAFRGVIGDDECNAHDGESIKE